ncbi:hypothetical protein C0J52_27481 [Blattella germanica]|nr:hypothetical protein C0J52_27481 [Blattella germanica]
MCRRQYPNDVCNRGTAEVISTWTMKTMDRLTETSDCCLSSHLPVILLFSFSCYFFPNAEQERKWSPRLGAVHDGSPPPRACVVNKRLEKVNSVAIIEDTGGFSGIIVGAHEVGHLLGAVHDGSPPPSYLGGPGAEKCRWEDGYIMSDLRHTEKGFRWSPCSIQSFHHFLNGDTATCLYNSPHEDESLPRVLPGKLLTLDAQCRKDRGTSACFKDDRVCAQLFCFDAGSGYCVAYRPAAEGSPCGDGQYCLNGRCVAEHENIIPDYSQNTPAYLRRNDADSAATQTRPIYARLPNATSQRYELILR